MQSINRLVNMMAALRDPDTGCPWDKQQDFSSIAPYTIEEAYEVADAIDRGAMQELRCELGDLLFQVIYHAQMASEKGEFDFSDVVEAICHKIEWRHPHVFADEKIATADEQTRAWEQHKRRERRQDGNDTGLLSGIAPAIPALARAQKLQQRAATIGFDWSEAQAVMAKLHEEIQELSGEMANIGKTERNDETVLDGLEDELGDVLFSCVNLARHLRVDAEAALRKANRKFEQRFRFMETQLADAGETLEEASLEQLDTLWQRAKQEKG